MTFSEETGYDTDVELEDLARKIMREGLPEAKPQESGLEKMHAMLPDARVLPIQERLWIEKPILAKYDTRFATAVIEPPWFGQLPDGTVAKTWKPVCQFLLSSTHPRPLQRKMGLNHVNIATAWLREWEAAERERKHFVTGESIDPAERIFRALAIKHEQDLLSLESMI